METPMIRIDFPSPFDIVDIDHPDILDWRRCSFSLHLCPGDKLYFLATIRRKKGGRGGPELFESPAFLAAIQSAFEDILRPVHPAYCGQTGRVPMSFRPLLNAGTRGCANPDDKSPTLSFALNDDFARPLMHLSQHQRIAIYSSAASVASRLARKRRGAAR